MTPSMTLDNVVNPNRGAELMALGADTAGAVDRALCRAAGMTDERIEWLVESGRWQSPFLRVYVTFSGPIPLLTLHHAALLYAGEGAALSHDTAGCYWRVCRRPEAIHVTVPYRRTVADQPGLVLHRSRTFTDDDVHPVFTPRRTRIERERATTTERLRAALESHQKTRWRKIVLEALPDLRAGAHSALELRDAALRRRHGLPMGTRQARRSGDGTEYLDVVIEEWRVHVELDGRLGHDRAREMWRDMKRDNRSELAQYRHLRYGWVDMIERPCDAAIQQALVLRQQGWPGAFTRCPDCPRELPHSL